LSPTEIIIGVYIAIVAAATLYFAIAVIQKERGKLVTPEEVGIEVEKLGVTALAEGVPLTEVKGIGPFRAERLKSAGIESVEDLAASSPEEVAGALKVSEERAFRFILNARFLLERKQREG
jgi:predicted flap endonuclease-1-like 5' DNA nuclease